MENVVLYLDIRQTCRIPSSISRNSFNPDTDQAVEVIRKEMRDINKIAVSNQIHQKIKRKTNFDKKAKHRLATSISIENNKNNKKYFKINKK